MLSVTPLGTCRITNPLRLLAELRLIDLNMTRVFGYVHTTKEILQQISFLYGSAEFPADIQPLVGPHISHSRCHGAHKCSDHYFVEISSRKVLTVGAFCIQLNHFSRLL